MANTAIELAELKISKDIYEYVANTLYDLTDCECIITVTEFDHQNDQWHMMAVKGISKTTKDITKILGFDLMKMKGPIKTKDYDKIATGKLTNLDFDLPRLTNGSFSKKIGDALKKLIPFNNLFSIAFRFKKEIFGNITFITKSVAGDFDTKFIESFISQASLFLSKIITQKDLQISEEKYRLLIENGPSVFWITNKNGNTNYISPNVKKVYGFTSEEIYQNGSELWLNRIHKHDIENVLTNFKEIFEKNKRFEVTYRIKNKKGKWIWLQDIGEKYVMENGEEVAYGIFKDITEIKNAENIIKESEERYRQLFDNMTSGFAVHEMIYDDNKNPIDYKYLQINPAFETLTGVKVKVLLGKTLKDLMPDTEDYWIETYNKVATTGKSIKYENYAREIGKYFDAYAFSHKKGQFAVIFNDITERKKIEDSLKESEEKFKDFANSITDIYFAMDQNLNYTFWNSACEKLLGFKSEEMIGKSYYDFDFNKGYEWVAQKYKQVIVAGQADSFEVEFGEGEYKMSFYVNVYPTKNGILIYLQNITERKQLEKELNTTQLHYTDFINTSLDQVTYWKVPDGLKVDIPIKQQIDMIYESICIDANKIAWEIFGFKKKSDIIGIKYIDIIQEKTSDKHFTEFIKGNYQLNNCEVYVKPFNKDEWCGLQNMYGTIEDGKLKYIWSTAKDITELKQYERGLKAKNEELSDLNNKLIDSEERYKQLSDLNHEGIVIHKQGVVLDSNKAFCNIFGYEPDELIGTFVLDKIFTPESAEKAKEKVRTEDTEKSIFEGKKKDGSIIFIEIQARSIKYKGQKVRVASIRDITEKVERDKELKESEERFRTVVTNSIPIIFMYDLRGNILLSEGKMLSVFGLKPGEAVGNNIFENYKEHPDIIKALKMPLKGESFEGIIELENLSFDVFYSSNRDSKGNIIGAIGITMDITERKIAVEELKASEEKFRNIFHSSTDGILITDEKHQIISFNQTLTDILGFQKVEEENKEIFDYILPKYIPIIKERRKSLFQNKTVKPVEIEIFNSSGKIVPVEVNSKLINYSNRKVILSLFRDITERKEAERKILNAIIKTEEKERERFAADLHDDIGPLLSSIKLLVNVLHDAKNPDEKENILNKSYEVINSAIASTREISNNLSPHLLNNFGLNAALKSFCSKINAGKKIEIEYESNLSDIKFNKNQEVTVYRIFIELINNTIKHAKAKQVKIDLNYIESKLICYYKDDGVGFNVDQKLKKLNKGFGLNNIIHRIESLNGKYKIESQGGKGMQVTIQINIENE